MVEKSMKAQPFFRQQAWQLLQQELDQWRARAEIATFWWRDDDACRVTPELEQLNALSTEYGVPAALAVIPNQLHDDLAPYVAQHQNLSVLQHGFDHVSHARPGQKKLELGGSVSAETICNQLSRGKHILEQSFGNNFVAVVVPPWNRIDDSIVRRLPGLKFGGLSSMWARHCYQHSADFVQVNTHVDPVAWRQNQVFIGESLALAQIVQHLAAKRLGFRDPRAATGLLTHHLVQKASVWNFCEQLFRFLSSQDNVRWLSAPEIWPRQDLARSSII